ncbi:hypothetical protein NQ318_020434 [Aromia moschata]|uniref:Uncharacterized protein n=1 Tax=Aromia moschata TaxID=1265417 RepID=A0AAV8YLQ9_9CUCU|nr:hypothetical protein NQ318_020434 [Aromia moschata]
MDIQLERELSLQEALELAYVEDDVDITAIYTEPPEISVLSPALVGAVVQPPLYIATHVEVRDEHCFVDAILLSGLVESKITVRQCVGRRRLFLEAVLLNIELRGLPHFNLAKDGHVQLAHIDEARDIYECEKYLFYSMSSNHYAIYK